MKSFDSEVWSQSNEFFSFDFLDLLIMSHTLPL